MTKYILFLLFSISILTSCNDQSEYPMDKRYWTPTEYDNVIRYIAFVKPKEKRHPEFSNPETAPVIKKLTDTQNFLVILTDEELGISHRSNMATKFFEEYRALSDAYYLTDRQDKFVYGKELIEIQKFGLELQLHYFKLGNENIKDNVDDPESRETKRLISSNVKTIYKNYNNYLDFVNMEDAFNEEELKSFSEGIRIYFDKLFKTFPSGNLEITKNKAELMLKKSLNKDVQRELENLLQKIDKQQ